MRVTLDEAMKRLPLPATERWPEGVWDVEAMARGTMSVILFAPRGKDYQTSHGQDELYIVMSGSGVLQVEDERIAFGVGDVLFVAAGKFHRFVEFTEDLVTWAVFWGPEGGEEA
ncbi:MAG: cupin domain-containing protein [Acidobacteriota bacterium]